MAFLRRGEIGQRGVRQFCLVIRRAGDWTERLARDVECGRRPTHLFVRTMRGRGFMYHAQAYDRALVVATGAGIGPVLPYLLGSAPAGLECLWIGRDHRAAMGDDLVRRVLARGEVTLIDSSLGRPDVGSYVEAHTRPAMGRPSTPNGGAWIIGEMAQYMLMCCHAEEEEEPPAEPEAMDPVLLELHRNLREAGILLDSQRLRSTDSATSVRVRDGRTEITDGPFAVTKEVLAGYYLVECADLDEALKVAAELSDASHGTIEVRPVIPPEEWQGEAPA